MEVMRKLTAPLATGAVCALLAGCGLKGPLYLPEKTGEIVTRPAPAPAGDAPDSPQTIDSPRTGDTPAPEVTAPPGAEPEKDPDETGKKPSPTPR